MNDIETKAPDKKPLWMVGLSSGMMLVGRRGLTEGESPTTDSFIALEQPLLFFEMQSPQEKGKMVFGLRPFLFAMPTPVLTVKPILLQPIEGETLSILEPAYERSLVAERAQRAGIELAGDKPPSPIAAADIFRKPQ